MAKRKTSIFPFLYGLSLGVIGGVLLAPEKGEITRNKLIEKLEKASSQLKQTIEDLTHKKQDNEDTGESSGVVQEAIEKANQLMNEFDNLKEEIAKGE